MKILVIGDPHGDLKKIKKIPINDVGSILVVGDLGKATLARKRAFENSDRIKKGLLKLKEDGKFSKSVYKEVYDSTLEVANYLSKLVPTYSILGNIGVNMVKNYEVRKDEMKYKIKLPYLGRELKKIKSFDVVKNRLRVLDDLRVGFLEYFIDTCWVKEFKPGNYEKSMKSAKKQTDKAKRILRNFKNLDVLICHQPPYGYLDKVTGKYGAPKFYQGKHAGSKVILDYIKKHQPKYVFCGHIHEGEGKAKIGKSEIYNLGIAGHKIVNFK